MHKRCVRRISIGVSPTLAAAFMSLPIKRAQDLRPTSDAGARHHARFIERGDERWWFKCAFEEAIYALAEHFENGGTTWGMRFEVVAESPGRRGLARERQQAQVCRLLHEVAAEATESEEAEP